MVCAGAGKQAGYSLAPLLITVSMVMFGRDSRFQTRQKLDI